MGANRCTFTCSHPQSSLSLRGAQRVTDTPSPTTERRHSATRRPCESVPTVLPVIPNGLETGPANDTHRPRNQVSATCPGSALDATVATGHLRLLSPGNVAGKTEEPYLSSYLILINSDLI